MRISYEWLKEYVDVTLPPDELRTLLTMSGLSVESVERAGGDHVYDIEVTSNRPDWLSVMGVAREVAALTGARVKAPSAAVAKTPGKEARPGVTIADRALSARYTCRAIRGVTVAPSPDYLARHLVSVGLRPINNIVDVTNFCLFETGEPMHAFDLDKLAGGCVTVRRAVKGERLVTIDGVTRELDGTMIVIADAAKPVALAGIMGGRDTEVTAATKNILLEAASFDPVSIRRTARKLVLSTDSSYRFERKVALENIRYASDRATSLIIALAGGQAGALVEAGAKSPKRKPIELRLATIEKLVGTAPSASRVKKILTSLGMDVRAARPTRGAGASFTVAVPDFRDDITMEADLVEEVARIHGYDKVPETLPAVTDQPVRIARDRVVCRAIRESLVSQGAFEIMTYSLLGTKALADAGRPPADVIAIRNPLSAEQEAMRTHLLPGMLGAIARNINRKTGPLKLFELGAVYAKRAPDEFSESSALAIAMTGEIAPGWLAPARAATFYDLKGLVEAALAALGIAGATFAAATDPSLSSSQCASISLGGEAIGSIGEVAGHIAKAFDIKETVYYCQIAVAPLVERAHLQRMAIPLPRFPAVSRDISILADKRTAHALIDAVIRAAGGALLTNLELIDRYTGKQVPAGKVSLTYRLEYQDATRTLEEKDVQGVHARVLDALAARCGATLR